MRPLLPDEAPETPDKWQDVMADIEKIIMPGVTHWHSPRFHAYFPTANSYPAIVADMLSGAIACIGFTWVSRTLSKGWNKQFFNPLEPELNPIRYLLALLRAHHFLHVSRIRVKLLTLR